MFPQGVLPAKWKESLVEIHPVITALGEQEVFYRSHLYYTDGKKKMAMLKPVTTAQQAITRNLPQSWNTHKTAYPLILNRLPYILLLDCDHCVIDGKLHPLVAELQERFPTYWDISYSGQGRHALAFTELQHIHGRKKLICPLPDTPDGKIEIFLGCQPALLTTQHDRVLPLKNCDQELQTWLTDHHIFPEKSRKHSGGEEIGGIHYTFFPSERFTPWLTAHPIFPGKTKRHLLHHLWNAEKYRYGNGWQPVYEPQVAKLLGITTPLLSKHLRELERDGWLFREHGTYSTGRRSLSIRLRVDKQFLQAGQGDEQ